MAQVTRRPDQRDRTGGAHDRDDPPTMNTKKMMSWANEKRSGAVRGLDGVVGARNHLPAIALELASGQHVGCHLRDTIVRTGGQANLDLCG